MSMPPTLHPRVPRPGSTAVGRDLLLLERAGVLIAELGEDLDRQLEQEARPSERLRLLRETTVQITRTANDAIQAYRRMKRVLDASVASANGNAQDVAAMRTRLSMERRALLAVLDKAGARYPERPQTPTMTA